MYAICPDALSFVGSWTFLAGAAVSLGWACLHNKQFLSLRVLYSPGAHHDPTHPRGLNVHPAISVFPENCRCWRIADGGSEEAHPPTEPQFPHLDLI